MLKPQLATLVLLTACTSERLDVTNLVHESQIDGTIQADNSELPDVNSAETQMCVAADTTVYVVWTDERDNADSGRRDVWATISEPFSGNQQGGGSSGQNRVFEAAPRKINQGSGNVSRPDIACNETGLYVVWEDDRDGLLQNSQVYFNHLVIDPVSPDGYSQLPEDVLLENDTEGATQSLEPQIDGSGDEMFVTWYDNANGSFDIFVTRTGDGGRNWQPNPVAVDGDFPPGAAFSSVPQLMSSASASDAWIVWEDSRDAVEGGGADIYVTTVTDALSAQPPARLDVGADDAPGSSASFLPQLCGDGGQNVYVVWFDERNGTSARDIFYNYSSDAGLTWLDEAVRLDTHDPPGLTDSVGVTCVGEESGAHVVWQDQLAGAFDIYYQFIDAGEVAGDAQPLQLDVGVDPGTSNSVEPVVAIDGSTLMVAWQDFRFSTASGGDADGLSDLFYAFADENDGFSDDEDIQLDSWVDGNSFKIDLNVSVIGGTWYAAWTDGRDGDDDVFFSTAQLGEEIPSVTLEDLANSEGPL